MNEDLSTPRPQRRTLLLALSGAAALTACGGGWDAGTAPEIQEFSGDRTSYFVGERAQLRVRFSGGAGRIEPGIGAVFSGTAVNTGVLDAGRQYRLVVEAPGQAPASRSLALPVVFRDRYQTFAAPAVSSHAAVATADGGALIIGGSRGESTLSSLIDRFDPATRGFTRIGQLATGRAGHSAVRLTNGAVLVFGGVTSVNQAPFAELVDERTGAAVRAGVLAQPRSRHAAVVLADGRVLAIGGLNRDSVEIWDPATRTWRLVAQRMAHTREYASATLLADGRVLVVGGQTPANAYVLAEIFDPRTETFSAVATAPAERRWLHSAHRLSDGSVLIAGGIGGTAFGTLLSAVWRFQPATQTFATMPALNSARVFAAGVMTPNDELLLFGGQTTSEFSSTTGHSYRAALNGGAQRALPLLPAEVLFHSATRLSDGRVLVVGGEDNFATFATRGALYE